MTIVSNTTPINYLILIGHQDILKTLFGRIIIPQAVFDELQRNVAPAVVRAWISSNPGWVEIKQVTSTPDTLLLRLHPGEREAILLAEELNAHILIIDERRGRKEAARRGLMVTGTIGILEQAAARDLIDLQDALDNLQKTNFRTSEEVIRQSLERNAKREESN